MLRSKLIPMACSTLAVLALTLATAPQADGGWLHARRARRCCGCPCASRARHAAPGYAASAPAYRPAPTPQAAYRGPVAATAGGSPGESTGSFLGWLNNVRARHGLGPVGWDAGLAGLAAANSSRGFAHHPGTNPGRQNVGVGGLGAVQAAWLASPAHASALLDPRVRRAGLANVGGVWTLNLN